MKSRLILPILALGCMAFAACAGGAAPPDSDETSLDGVRQAVASNQIATPTPVHDQIPVDQWLNVLLAGRSACFSNAVFRHALARVHNCKLGVAPIPVSSVSVQNGSFTCSGPATDHDDDDSRGVPGSGWDCTSALRLTRAALSRS